MMSIVISIVSCILIGYLLGCINLSYILSRHKGFDIRERGSGNAGASNVIILMGKKKGAIVALTDIFKAFFAVKLSVALFPEIAFAGALAATSVILGHIFPFYMEFKGGKGLASLGGSILALDYRMFIVLLVVALFIAIITDYICFVPITVSIIFPIMYGIIHFSIVSTLILFIASFFICFRHVENIRRIKTGRELHFSFLWNRKSEAKRLGVEDPNEETEEIVCQRGRF